ncbi:MAG TPA: mandelate racemase/muconate lactonizing enzyme family protein [Bryobacteraceae bacterium]|nr:mandelate racemase/muconate lactonizing enzyme family protein [Bryobacteraceae bacterium]
MLSRRHFGRMGAGAFAAGFATIAPLVAAESKPLRKAPRIRVTDIESFSCAIPSQGPPDPLKLYRFAVTRVFTDAGITGTSFLACPRDGLERWVKPVLVGDDLFAVDRHLQRLQMERGESGVQYWSGVEHAMWDAIGKAMGRPVAELLGGARTRLRVYRTSVFPGKQDQSDVPYEKQAAFAARLEKSGYTAMKIRAWRPRPMDDVEALKVIRSAVSPAFAVMFDRTAVRPGWVWDYPTALRVARGMEKHGAYWLEEPFNGYDLESPARLAAEVDLPITGGELGNSLFHFQQFLKHKTYDIVQPDTRICGGIWVAKKISVMAEAFGVRCIQHGTSGLALAGYIQAGCAMNNCEFQEIIGGPNLPEEEWEPGIKLLKTPYAFRVEKGYVHLSDLPGLGLDVNEDALKEYRRG